MKKLMMAAVVAACAAETFAMPTKAEMTKAQPLVVELMAPAMAKYKQAPYKEKAKAAAKVGDASSEFAKAAETEAAKFLLLKGAVNFYTRGEQYDKAADTVAELQRAVKDVPPAVIAEITGKATSRISEAKAPRLYAVFRTAKLQVRASDEAKALKTKLKKAKSDALQRKYAEALAVSGDWKAAYAEFAKVSDAKLKEIVKAEAEGNAKSAESGEFWWAYEPAFEEADDFFKSHAAAYYRKALDAGEITGLKKNLVEQRIKGVVAEVAPSVKVVKGATTSTAAACVTNGKYDIVTGGKSPFEEKNGTLAMKLENGKTVEFVKCPAGEVQLLTDYEKNEMRKVKITRPYWIMKVPLGTRDILEGISYFEIGKDWCWNKTELGFPQLEKFCTDYTKELSRYLPKGYVLRLPSLAEFEHAYHAGNYEKWDVYGNVFRGHSEEELKKSMNSWGVGYFNYREKVLDRPTPNDVKSVDSGDGVSIAKVSQADDFLMWNEVDKMPRLRRNIRDKRLEYVSLEKDGGDWVGHQRLVIGPDLVSEWRAKHGASGATTSAAASTSAPVSGKAWQEKGNTAILTLPNGEKLEFAKCPAGSVDMRIGIKDWIKYPKTKKVRISRPFWVMTHPMVRDNFEGYPEYSTMFGPKNSMHPTEGYYENVVTFTETITEELKDSLPKGYVIRLPSFAEWDYSFRAGSRDPDDPYSNFDVSRRPENTARCQECLIYGTPREKGMEGKSKRNKWGLHDYWREKLLDKVDASNAVAEGEWKDGDENGGEIKALRIEAVDEVDPLLWSESEKSYPMVRQQADWRCATAGHKWSHFRLVIGPDLVSEWRAKHGKK